MQARTRKTTNRNEKKSKEWFSSGETAVALSFAPIFPVRKRVRLTYATSFNVTGTTGAAGAQVFSVNGLFDPDITGVGHQPMGFDQMMLYYEHYIGIRTKLSVWAVNLNTTLPANVGISINASVTPVTVATTLVESGNMEWLTLSVAGGGNSSKKLSSSVDVGHFEGIDDVTDMSDLRGDTSSNPTEQVYFHVVAWDPSGGTVSPTFTATLEIEAWFVEPRKPTASVTREQIHALHEAYLMKKSICKLSDSIRSDCKIATR